MTQMFTFNTTASIRFGLGMINELGGWIKHEMGKDSVLIVTDQGVVSTGIIERLTECLHAANICVNIYDEVKADPPTDVILTVANIAKQSQVGCVVGIGGGSSLDTAKLAAFLAQSTQSIEEIYGVGNARGTRLPLVLIPTTAGTGSEVTPIAIVTTGEQEKMGIVSPIILPDIALLDPELTISLPNDVTAATGIDAMVHAIEAYASINPNNNPISRMLAKQALKLMGESLEVAVYNPNNMYARSQMLLGSLMAGQAFANSPVAAVHALAYPLGTHFKISHGLSNALVLAHVLRFNIETTALPYAELAPYVFGDSICGKTDKETALALVRKLQDLMERCELQQTLRRVGVIQADLPMLAKDAMRQSRLLVNNPREMTTIQAQAIYEAAL